MATTVILNERHFKAAEKKARELGKTPGRYIESLIDAAAMSFDEILAPVREGFRKSGVSAEELDDAVAAARKATRKKAPRKARK
jgi:hypothetical protein